jgi:acyl-coenzyme A synthetase/AMP-(fatty) acid ligase
MIRTIWGDPERFKKSYYPADFKGKYYLAGDGAIRDAKTGYFTITGRIDDVLNVSGHRMGTMEIESALVSCTDLVAEAAVVGRPDDTTGEAICAFVVLKRPRPTGDEAKRSPSRAAQLGGQGDRPDRQAQGHPLRRQPAQDPLGKIMRRLLRSASPRAKPSPRTPARWKTRRSWISWSSTSCRLWRARCATSRPVSASPPCATRPSTCASRWNRARWTWRWAICPT